MMGTHHTIPAAKLKPKTLLPLINTAWQSHNQNPFTAKDAKAAKENQHLNHTFAPLSAGSGTRRKIRRTRRKARKSSHREKNLADM
jgi:hypothetical protein